MFLRFARFHQKSRKQWTDRKKQPSVTLHCTSVLNKKQKNKRKDAWAYLFVTKHETLLAHRHANTSLQSDIQCFFHWRMHTTDTDSHILEPLHLHANHSTKASGAKAALGMQRSSIVHIESVFCLDEQSYQHNLKNWLAQWTATLDSGQWAGSL